MRSSPSLVSIINCTSHHNRSTSELSQSTGKLRCHCGVHDSIATLVVVLFSRVPRGRWLSKEMRSVIALHHRELRTTEAHRHVISHTLSDGATIINREVMCSLSSYLCCKVCLLLFVSLNLWSLCLCSFLKNGPCFVADSSTVVSLFWFV